MNSIILVFGLLLGLIYADPATTNESLWLKTISLSITIVVVVGFHSSGRYIIQPPQI